MIQRNWVRSGPSFEVNFFEIFRENVKVESGAVGLIGRSLGTYEKSAKRKRTKVFVMYVKALVDDFEEKDVKNQKWFSLDEAQRILGSSRPFQAKCLEALKSS